MKKIHIFLIFSLFLSSLWAQHETVSKKETPVEQFVKQTTIGGHWFLNYKYNDVLNENKFSLSRAYLTVKTKFAKNLSARITQDLTVDKEGDDKGNVELRLKYLYMAWQLPDFGFFTGSHFEFGEVHRPWLDYEEHINSYRVQGTMPVERMHLFNSAGFGVTFVTLLGKKMDNDYTHHVSHAYPGTYGSFAVGVYNGGGYHALENNAEKNVEMRLSVRPLGEKLPGLQVSYSGIYGTGNIPESPMMNFSMVFLSYEAQWFMLSAQYFTGEGNQGGSLIYYRSNSQGGLDMLSDTHAGYSGFCEMKIPHTKLALFGRYDAFKTNVTAIEHRNIIGGISYRFTKKSKLLLDYDQATTTESGESSITGIAEIALEVHF